MTDPDTSLEQVPAWVVPLPRAARLPKRRCLISGRGTLRRNIELASDVAALLRQPAKAIGVAADFVDVEVAFIVQRPEQFLHPLEHGSEIGGLFVLGVGALADVDVEPVACELLLGERLAAGKPVRRIDGLDDDRGDLRILVQDFGGEFRDGGGDVGLERWRGARARIGDGDERHDLSPYGFGAGQLREPKLDPPSSFWYLIHRNNNDKCL